MLPGRDDPDFKFAAPWEAKAFAIVVKMAEEGHFAWPEWVERFAQEVATSQKPYYEQWLDAAEALLIAKNLTSREQLAAKHFAFAAAGDGHPRR